MFFFTHLNKATIAVNFTLKYSFLADMDQTDQHAEKVGLLQSGHISCFSACFLSLRSLLHL